ncbi:Uncharacterised protein [Salmonella enterica subsp. enterica serovar Bovismorbificans]|nr:Uncharacterised protein [Salmonella enterica subsp. enterica serovar Bovismorbificans]
MCSVPYCPWISTPPAPTGVLTPLALVMAVTVVPVGAVSSVMTLPVLMVGPLIIPALVWCTSTSRLVYDPVASRLVL